MVRTQSTAMATALISAVLVLCVDAMASGPEVAVLPVTGDGGSSATLDIVTETLQARLGKLGFSATSASKVQTAMATKCTDSGCTAAQSIAVGKAVGSAHVLTTTVQKYGDGVMIRMVMFDVADGSSNKQAFKADKSAVLASSVKMLSKVLPSSTPAVFTAPAPKKKASPDPAPTYKPEKTTPKPLAPVKPTKTFKKPIDLDPEPTIAIESSLVSDEQSAFDHIDGEWKKLQKRSTGLLAAGGLLTIGGMTLTVVSIVQWVAFADWQKRARDNQCIDCIDLVDGKIKKNAIITGVAAGVLLPGIITLAAGITQRMLALKLKQEAAALLPDLNLALGPYGGHLTATWSF